MRVKEKRENEEEKKENCKTEGGKFKIKGEKVWKWAEDFFLNHWNLFGVYKKKNFYQEKAFHAGKKFGKSDFNPWISSILRILSTLGIFL